MRILLVSIGVLASLVLIVLSALLNYRFGHSLGSNEIDAFVYGSVSAAADVLKALTPFFIFRLVQVKRRIIAVFGAVMWCVFTAYSLASAVGFAAANRSAVGAESAGKQVVREDLRGALADAVVRRNKLAFSRPKAEVAKLLEGVRQHKRWTSTKGCSDATVSESRVFCRGYFELEAELERSIRDEELQEEIVGLRKRMHAAQEQVSVGTPKAQVELISEVFGKKEKRVEVALVLLLALLVEAGSGFGLLLALGGVERKGSAIKYGDVADFCAERIEGDAGAETTLAEFYGRYARWCHQAGGEVVPYSRFSDELGWLLEGVVPSAERHGEVVFSGVRGR